MIRRIGIFIALAIFFLNCGVSNQKDQCQRKIALKGTDTKSCFKNIGMSKFLLSFSENPNAENDPNEFGNQWFNLALANCLAAVEAEKNCNKKSEYIPTIGEGN